MFKNKEPVKGLNPDEAVAYGAAVQVGCVSICFFIVTITIWDITLDDDL